MEIGFDTLAPFALIIVFAYTIFGLTGFGSAVTAMPMLMLLNLLARGNPRPLAGALGGRLGRAGPAWCCATYENDAHFLLPRHAPWC